MFSGSKKFFLIALFTIVLIVLVNLVWWWHYQKTSVMLENQLSRRLSTIAQTAALALNPETVENLAFGDLRAYDQAALILEEIRSSDSLAEIFILDENYKYLFTTSLQPDSVYFLRSLNQTFIDSIFFGFAQQAVTTPAYKTGEIFLKSAFAPLLDPDGYLLAVLGVEADVDYYDNLTELRQNLYYASGISIIGGLVLGIFFLLLQVRINRAEQQIFLTQSHAFLGRMVAVVTHELKNPLMIIRASAERLKKKHPSEEADFIIEEVDRLNSIATGYLNFARADVSLVAGDNLETFNLNELVASIKKHITEKYGGKELSWLETASPPDSLSLTGYRRSLRQVILNLLINGAEACLAKSGRIEIGLAVEKRDNRIRIIISDTGGGISKKEMKKLFTPFYTTKQSGSGLGLYLSRKIVTEMGGELKLESENEKTRAIIILPDKPKT